MEGGGNTRASSLPSSQMREANIGRKTCDLLPFPLASNGYEKVIRQKNVGKVKSRGYTQIGYTHESTYYNVFVTQQNRI